MKRLMFAALSTLVLFAVANSKLLAKGHVPDDVRRTTTIELSDR